MTSRLIFELRRGAYGEENPTIADLLAGSEARVGPSMLSIATMKFLGNIGETLRIDEEEGDNQKDDVDYEEKDTMALSEISPTTEASPVP